MRLQITDNRLIVRTILQIHADHLHAHSLQAGLKFAMYPSSFRMRAISAFNFEAGTSSFWWRARMELRMRVRKVCYWVCQVHQVSFIPRSLASAPLQKRSQEPAGMLLHLLHPDFCISAASNGSYEMRSLEFA